MWHTCQLIMIVSLDIINNNQIRCHSLGFCNVTGTFIYFKTINVRVPFNFTTWNKVVYTSGYVITYIIKTTEPNHLILILNLANKSYFMIKVNFCHLLAWFKNYDPLKVGVNSFWDTLYIFYNPQVSSKTLIFILLKAVYILCVPERSYQKFDAMLLKKNKNLTTPVCWTKCNSLFDLCSKYQKNSLIIT